MYTTCRVGVLSSEISKHSKISPPPSLRSHLTSSPMGYDYGIYRLEVKSEIGLTGTHSHITSLSSCTQNRITTAIEPANMYK